MPCVLSTAQREKNRRPCAVSMFLTGDRLRESVNSLQVRNGFAYPLYYNTVFRALRETLNEALEEARGANRGYWTLR